MPTIEKTNADYEGDDPAEIVRLQVRSQRIRNYENLQTNKHLRFLGDQDFTAEEVKDEPEELDPPPAFFDYIQYRRGSRGKMAVKNEDVFILFGQNGLLSWILIILYIVIMGGGVGDKKVGAFAKLFTKLTRLLVGAFFIKFLFICFSEIGLHDITVAQPILYRISYFTSMFTLNIYIFDMTYAYFVVKKGYDEK